MNTFTQVQAWCAGAQEQFGDPSIPVCQLFVRWHEDVLSSSSEDLVVGWLDGEIVLILGLGPDIPFVPIRVQMGQAAFGEHGELVAFGVERIAPGLWSMTPSLNLEGGIHAFVVLYGVPDPAPWERRIVLP